MPDDLDIQLISTVDLAQELGKRFDSLIVYGIQKNPKANNQSLYFDHYIGDQATIIGLCELMKIKAQEDFNKNGEE